MFKHPMEKMLYEGEPGADGGGGAPPVVQPAPNVTDGGTVVPPSGAPAQPPAGDGAGKSWLESLPEDLRKDPSLQLFKEPGALAKSWVNAQKMIGADKVVIPGEKATEEEVSAFYQKLGRPESADKYDFKMPDGKQMDEGFAKGFKETAFKSGLNPKQVQNMVDWYNTAAEEAMNGAQSKQDMELRSLLDNYKQTLGGEERFNATLDKAKGAVRTLADDQFKAFLRDSGMGSRPEAIGFFAKLADMMGEDKIRDGTAVPFSNQDPAALQKEIEEIESKMFKDLNSPNMSVWVEQRNALYSRMGSLKK